MKEPINIDCLQPYSQLYKAILKHYPLGHMRYSDYFNRFYGIKLLENYINQKVVNEGNLEKIWKKRIKVFIEKESGCNIDDAIFGFVPNYSGIISLKKEGNSSEFYQLQFFISFIDNFFTIHIKNIQKDITGKRNPGYGYFVKEMVVSPVDYFFGDLFCKVQSAINKTIENAKFIPFSLYSKPIEGLSVLFSDEPNYPLGGAFFNIDIPSTNPIKVIGDIDYKLAELK